MRLSNSVGYLHLEPVRQAGNVGNPVPDIHLTKRNKTLVDLVGGGVQRPPEEGDRPTKKERPAARSMNRADDKKSPDTVLYEMDDLVCVIEESDTRT